MAFNSTIKNIIFDLGGIIIDIDAKKTIEALSKASKQLVTPQQYEQILIDYEAGKFDDYSLRTTIKELIKDVRHRPTMECHVRSNSPQKNIIYPGTKKTL